MSRYESGFRFDAEAVPGDSPVSSEALFGSGREFAIAHAGEIYVLRITRAGKLILNKAEAGTMNEMRGAEAARDTGATQPLLQSGVRARDLAQSMGLSEAELVAAHRGAEVIRLGDDMRAIISALPSLGDIMALTRNESAVHEKVGRYGNISLGDVHGLVLNGDIDQRLFLSHWKSAFALSLPGETGPRRSLQIFDEYGDAVLKIHLKPQSDLAAYEALVARFAAANPSSLVVKKRVAKKPAPVASELDVEAFRRAFEGMQDVHEFFPLLKRHALSRRSAIDIVDARYVTRLVADAPRKMLEAAAASRLPIMCFVGNAGCIQIHSGPVETIKAVGPWINVLDPRFNLHLREDHVAECWAVRKPSRDGLITSIELYDSAGELITQFFGVRQEKHPENPDWQALVASLAA